MSAAMSPSREPARELDRRDRAARLVPFRGPAARGGGPILGPVRASGHGRGAVFRCIIMNGAKPGASSFHEGQPAGPSGARLVRAKAAMFVSHGRGGSAQEMSSPAEVSAQPTRVIRPWNRARQPDVAAFIGSCQMCSPLLTVIAWAIR